MTCRAAKESPEVQKFIHRVASDFGMPCRTLAEQRQVYGAFEMTSWVNKSGLPKPSRWFSWVEASDYQLTEFWGSRMILKTYLESPLRDLPIPEESGDFRSMRDDGAGGLLLAYKCLSQGVWEDANILSVLGKVL